MKQFYTLCVVAFQLLSIVSASPVAEEALVDTCTCRGRHYNDVFHQSHDSAHYSDFENLFPNCPKPLTRWILNGSPLDRSVYSGNHFCGCMTHQGAPVRNGFVRC